MLRAADAIHRTDTGRQRRGNEDSAYAAAPVFALADGMGGAAAGEVASRIAIAAFERGLPASGTAEQRLAVVVQRANREIFDAAQADQRLDGMGTTLTAVLLDAENLALALAHVGDSRAYRLRGGELTRLTEDHSLVEELVKDGKLTEEEAFEHPQRSIITRALGQEPVVEVDTFSYPVRPGDVILLCSDGLTDMLPEKTVGELLVGSPSLERAAQRLIDEANEAGGRDNITVVLFRVEEAAGADDGSSTMVLPGAAAGAAGMRHGSPGRPAEARTDPGNGATGPYVTPQPDIIRSLARSGAARVGAAVPRPRRARLQSLPVEHREPVREFGVLGKTVAAILTVGMLLLLFGGGGYLATRQLYFLGTNRQGVVVLYRGLPYALPFGIDTYETYYVSGVPASLIPASRRGTLLNHTLHSESAGIKLINDLELGKIAG